MRGRTIGTLLVGGMGVVAGAVATVPPAAEAASGVCAGVARCRVVAHTDVTGDGARDAVGLVRHGADGAERGSVTVRVRTASGTLVTTRRRTEFWHGKLWQGAGRLDGRRGTELVVGRTTGAHAEVFTALTWRRGHLVVLDAPGRGRWWTVDAAVWVDLGWQHRRNDPRGIVRKRAAVREGSSTDGPFRGRLTTFRWSKQGWERIDRSVIFPMSEERASRWGGWRVRGIDRW